jgi:hypothetical protein
VAAASACAGEDACHDKGMLQALAGNSITAKLPLAKPPVF